VDELKRSLTKIAQYDLIVERFFPHMESYKSLLQRVRDTIDDLIRGITHVTFKDGLLGLRIAHLRLQKLSVFKSYFCKDEEEDTRVLNKMKKLKNRRDFLLLLDYDFESYTFLSAMEDRQRQLGDSSLSSTEEKAMALIKQAREDLGLNSLSMGSPAYMKTLYRIRAIEGFEQAFASYRYEDTGRSSGVVTAMIQECMGMLDASVVDDVDDTDILRTGLTEDDPIHELKRLFLSHYANARNVLLKWQSAMWVWFKEYFERIEVDGSYAFIDNIKCCSYFRDNFGLFFGSFVDDAYAECTKIIGEGLASWSTQVQQSLEHALSIDIREGSVEDTEQTRLSRIGSLNVVLVCGVLSQFKYFVDKYDPLLNFNERSTLDDSLNSAELEPMINKDMLLSKFVQITTRLEGLFDTSYNLLTSVSQVSEANAMSVGYAVLNVQDRLVLTLRPLCDSFLSYARTSALEREESSIRESHSSIENSRDMLVQSLRSFVEAMAKKSIDGIQCMLDAVRSGSYQHVETDRSMILDAVQGLLQSTQYDRRVYRNELQIFLSKLRDIASIFQEIVSSSKWLISNASDIRGDLFAMACDMHGLAELETSLIGRFDSSKLQSKDVDSKLGQPCREEEGSSSFDPQLADEFGEEEKEGLDLDDIQQAVYDFKHAFYSMIKSVEHPASSFSGTILANISLSYFYFSQVACLFKERTVLELQGIFEHWLAAASDHLATLEEQMETNLFIVTHLGDADELSAHATKLTKAVARLHELKLSFSLVFLGAKRSLDKLGISDKVYKLYSRFIYDEQEGIDAPILDEEGEKSLLYHHAQELRTRIASIDQASADLPLMNRYNTIASVLKDVDDLLPACFEKYGSIEKLLQAKFILVEEGKREKMERWAKSLVLDEFMSSYEEFV
jgi:hypothetical protein